MVHGTLVRTRLLMDTHAGVVELVEAGALQGAEQWRRPKALLAHLQVDQRYWAGQCLTRDADGRTLYVGGAVGAVSWRLLIAGLPAIMDMMGW